jgi:hypothetical protein
MLLVSRAVAAVIILIALALSALALLSGCTAIRSIVERPSLFNPHLRVAALEADPPRGWCELMWGSSGLPWHPIAQLLVCKDDAGHLVYLAPDAPGSGGLFSDTLGPLGSVVNGVTIPAY